MLAAHHWYWSYVGNLRRAYYSILVLVWLIVFLIFGSGKLADYRAAHQVVAGSDTGAVVIAPEALPYSAMAPPPSLKSDQVVAEAPLPEPTAQAAVDNVTSTVPVPVPDEMAEATTMATTKAITGAAAPVATGSGAPAIFVAVDTGTKQIYDDNKPAPATFKFMKAAVMPTPLHDVSPEYPDNARMMGFDGTAIIDMWLRKDGTVSAVMVKKTSGHAVLDSSAVKAASRSTFTPALGADGKPVNVWVERPFRFSLTGGR